MQDNMISKNTVKRAIFPLVVLVLLFSLFVGTAPVLANPGLTVGGAIVEAAVSPGEYQHIMVVSLDKGDAVTDITVKVEGYGQKLDGTLQILPLEDDTSPYSAASFISIDKTSFHLEPNRSQKVIATINIPAAVGDGGRYAVIEIYTAASKEGMVKVVSAIAVPIRLTIKGSQLTHKGEIIEITASEAVSGQPVDIFTIFQNTGNHHFKIKGEVAISDSQGEILETIRISLTPSLVIPTMSRQLKATFIPEGELPLGNYSIKSKVMLEDDTILDEATGSFEVKEPYVPPAPPACVILTPGSAATLETGDGRISISFPKGAVTSQVEVCLQNYPWEQLPGPPNGFELATTCFRVDGLSGLLAKDATVTVKYSDADLGRAQGDASRLRLARWDEANNEWSVLKTKVNSQAMTLSTTTNQLSIWAVMVATAGAPPTAAPTGVNWVVIGGVVAGIIIIALLVYLLAVRRRRGY